MTEVGTTAPRARSSAIKILSDAVRLLRTQPGATMLPMLVVQGFVGVFTAVTTLVLYLTVFDDEPIKSVGDLLDNTRGGPLVAYFIVSAVQLLFGQVARGATVVAVAAAAGGRPKRLSEALDPAFTKMGGLLLLALIMIGIAAVGGLTVVLIVIVPFVVLRFWISTEIYMLEDATPWGAMGRAWRQMRGSVLSFIALFLLTVAVVLLPFMLISALGLATAGDRTVRIVIGAVLAVVQGVLLSPIIALLSATSTLFYLKLKEGANGRNPA